ncbi:MAG TPA: DUF1015 domain-containing protein [Candidatus Dormibacteraeota bacterium]
MADVRAFAGYRYNPRRVDLAEVVAPPYDVLSDEQVAELKARSPYNVVHLTRPGSDYASAAHRLRDWTSQDILARDAHEIYLHEVAWEGKVRRDLLGALRLEPYGGAVLPHERTHRGPKEDRLALLRATGWALEPLWFLYDGSGTSLPGLLDEQFAEQPAVEFDFPAGERHRLWAVSDRDWHRRVSHALAPLPVLIADGHHRYETTLAYSEETGGDLDAASRFTPALLTDLADPGLVVLPTHRLLRAGVAVTGGEEVGSLPELLDRLVNGHVAAGTYRDGHYQVLELEGEVPAVELHRQVVDNLLGKRNPEEYLSYTRDPAEAVRAVDEGRAASAFFLGTPDLKVVLAKAREGMTMPQKTTYFHPKPPSGMVFHELDSQHLIED